MWKSTTRQSAVVRRFIAHHPTTLIGVLCGRRWIDYGVQDTIGQMHQVTTIFIVSDTNEYENIGAE